MVGEGGERAGAERRAALNSEPSKIFENCVCWALFAKGVLGSNSNFKGFFSFLYLKKIKFQKYMAVSKNFKTISLSPLA